MGSDSETFRFVLACVCNTGPEPSTFMQCGKVREKTSGVTETG